MVFVFHPVHRRIAARVRSRSISALISTIVVIVLIVVPVTLASVALVRELTEIAQSVQQRGTDVFDANSPGFGPIIQWAGHYLDSVDFDLRQFVVDQLKGFSGGIARQTIGLVGGIVRTIVSAFFIVFTMYYLFRDSEKIIAFAPQMLPLDRKQSEDLIKRAKEVIGASVHGVVTVGLIQGSVGGLAFWFLGLPSAVLWTFVMIVLSIIPMTGAPFVWIPAAVSLAMTGHWGRALILVAWGVLVIHPIDNFLRPRLVTKRAKLHELLVFFSVIGGLEVFGIMGIVLGPLLLAITISLLGVFKHPGSETLNLHSNQSVDA